MKIVNLTFVASALGVMGSVFAGGIYHWSGAEDGYWTNAHNWVEGVVPGEILQLDAGGNLVTNGVKTDIAYFGDELVSGGATTINFDGVHSISNLLTTGTQHAYIYGVGDTQFVPIHALGTFSAAETPETPVATIAGRLQTGVDCRDYKIGTDGYPAQIYGGDKVTIRNNSALGELVLNRWGWHTISTDPVYNKEGKKVALGSESGIIFDGTGDIRMIGNSGQGGQPNAQTIYRLKGTFYLDARYDYRAFNVESGLGNCRIVLGADGELRHPNGYYNAMSISSPLTVTGDGYLTFSAGYHSGQAIKWKCSQNSFYSDLVVDAKMRLYWGTTPTEANGGFDYRPGFWHTGGASAVIFTDRAENTMSNLVQLYSSSPGKLAIARFGMRGTNGAHGDQDFCVSYNNTIKYTGAGETTDRAFMLTNSMPTEAVTSRAAKMVFEQAGTGELVMDSPVTMATGATGTLTLKNETEFPGTWQHALEGALNITKTGVGVWKFGGVNTYTGATAVDGGTLYVKKGSNVSGSGVTLAANTELVFEGDENTPVTTTCAKVTTKGANVKIRVGRNCTVNLADVAQTSGGTLDIVTEGDAAVKIAGKTGDAPNYITINGRKAAFDASGKVKKYTVSVTETINVRGGVIRNGAAGVGIVDGGDLGDVTLSQDATTVSAVVQQANEDATVAVTDGQTLTAATLAIDEDKKNLALFGTGRFIAAAGAFMAWPESEGQELLVATKSLDLSKATSFTKEGFGTARFTGEFNYAGPIIVNVGELAVTKAAGAPSVTLSGAGTFAKEGAGDWQVAGDSSAFAGDYVVRGGTIEPATKDAYKAFGSDGKLVITNGAKLKIFDAAGGAVNYKQKHLHVSGSGETPALEINSGLNTAYPFHDLTLDGDATITGTDSANPSKDFYLVSQQQGEDPTVDLANHTFTKTGYGRLGFRDVSFLSPGIIDLQTTANFTSCGSCNMLFLCGTITGPEEGRVKARMDGGTMLVLSGTTQPVPIDVDIVSGDVYMGVWAANDRNLAHQNLGGTIDLQSADSMLALTGYSDSWRWLNFSGPITGLGGVKTVNPQGKYYFGGTNTYAGTTSFTFPNGSGSFGAATYASWQALPNFAKASFGWYGTANLRLSGDGGADTAWPLAKVGEFIRTASIKNNAFAALDLGETGDFTMNISDLGDSPANDRETGFGRNGHWADDYALTVNLDEDWGSELLHVGGYNGILRFQSPGGHHRFSCYRMRISGEGNSSTGRLEVVEGAEVRVGGGGIMVGGNDSSLAKVKVRNATLAGSTGWGSQPTVNLGGVTYSRGICEIEDGARVNASFAVGSGANAYGGAIFQTGGLWLQNSGITYLGHAANGYWEMSGGEVVFSNCTLRITFNVTNAVGLLRQTGGRIVFGGSSQLLGANVDNHAHILMTGGEFVSEGTQSRIAEWPYSSASAHDSEAVLTLDGASAHFCSSDNKSLFLANQTNGIAIVNLKAGTLEVGDITACYSKYPGSAAYVNFDGGTLKANKATTDWVKGVTRTEVGPNGAVVDTAGFDATLKNAFVAPSGKGVTGVDWSTQKGIRFSLNKTVNLWQKMALPYFVYIVGDGTGASAVMEFDRAAQQMTGLRIVSPGSGYTWAKAIITSGQTTGDNYGEHVEVTCTLGDVGASGDFTKKGAGTLTLTGANTYGGKTIVEGGILKLGAANALPEGSEIVLAGGGIEAAAGVALPATLTVTLTAAEIEANPKAKFVLLSCPEGLPATLPEIVFAEDGVPPKGWFVCKDGNQLVLRRVVGTVFYFR